MGTVPVSSHVAGVQAVWQQLDAAIGSLDGLARSAASCEEFYGEVLRRVIEALGAAAGAIWVRTDEASAESGDATPELLAVRTRTDDASAAGLMEAISRHGSRAAGLLGEARPLATRDDSMPGAADGGPSSLLFAPFLGGRTSGVIEICGCRVAGPEAERGCLRFLSAVAELIGDYHQRRENRLLAERLGQVAGFERLLEQIHGTIDPDAVAYRLANEGRSFVGCDRLSVVDLHKGRCRVLAVSGVEKVDRRAEGIRRLERLSRRVATGGEQVELPGAPGALPDEIAEEAAEYLDAAHASRLVMLPVHAEAEGDEPQTPRTVGLLAAEQFFGGIDQAMQQRLAALGRHGGLALANAQRLRTIPLGRMLAALGDAMSLSRLGKAAVVLLVVALGAALLAIVPGRLTVAARGELEPERLREVFAPSDGLVRKVHVRHGDPVAAGAVLAEMRNAQLELESKRLGGELETARKRLAAIEAKRLQAPQDTSLDRQRYNQLTAEKEECAAVVEGIRHQLDLVESQQAELLVRSPIDGTVLTWDVESLLDARPVGCGDVLMSVGDLKGTWQARLRVPEDRAGELLAAREASAGKLRVTFALATDPGRTFKGLCERVGVRTEVGEDGEAFVPVIVSVDRRQLPSLVPGTEVVATIDCGRRSLGYVWLHDVIDTVRLWISF